MASKSGFIRRAAPVQEDVDDGDADDGDYDEDAGADAGDEDNGGGGGDGAQSVEKTIGDLLGPGKPMKPFTFHPSLIEPNLDTKKLQTRTFLVSRFGSINDG
jgi:hypothetical protein